MNIETNTAQAGGGEASSAQTTTQTPNQTPAAAAPEAAQTATTARAPRNDAEAAQMEAAAKAATQPPAQPEADKAAAEEKRKNRTREFIERITRENAELRRQVSGAQPQQQPTQRAAQGAQPGNDGEPTLEDHDFDMGAFTRAHSKWAVEQALKEREAASQQRQASEKDIETEATYLTRVEEFASDHPDFNEVVWSIKFELPAAVQAAIKAHDLGPQIAYHLGNNEDDAFTLAGMQPQLAAAAVQRIAARLSAAPTGTAAPVLGNAPTAAAPAAAQPTAAAPPAPAKQLSNAPAPAPTLSGRSPSDTPPEKLTDDEWAKRERERRRKR